MRLVIADGQAPVRAALRLLLEEVTDHWVVDEVAEAEMLLAQAARLVPDVVLLDWELPGLRIAAFLPALRQLCPGVHVIVLSGRPEAQQAAQAVGVDGFINKGVPPEQVLHVIKTLMTR